ncbi:AIG_G0004270.mRNA.1.CDS.1 [Saccharomyces cerevisiae]|nr:AIG_G0004270.mRNA.1.CDS.1 [Saccharomyces cerevisiae]CAI6506153.1 AIG_G0004270.mRNA.1.CDS.1 [Saccharomyces cerevisiae]
MLRLFSLALITCLIYYSKNQGPSALVAAVGFGIAGYLATDMLIPRVGKSFIKIGLFGKDLSKPGRPVLPETIGAIPAAVYLFVMFIYIPFIFYKYMVITTSGGGHRDVSVVEDNGMNSNIFPHDKLSEYLSAILCLESTVLLGIADDVFDLRWRHKFFLPAIAAIPLLMVYYVDFGVTHVLIPGFMERWLKKTSVDLGLWYYVYMASMAIFCPNSINILAGVNGLEVGQCIVLAILALLNDLLYFSMGPLATRDSHRFSAVLIIPFLGVSLALWKWNRWPATVFVGDTYCYFAGMVFAVVGILGHFSKTMLLLFIPQIVNFIYSCPQLFKLVPCPRHRLPKFNEKDGLMYPSRANLKEEPPKSIFKPILKLLYCLHLIDLEFDENNEIISTSNMTLINLTLVWFGPMREDKLCNTILKLQFCIGILALLGRHAIGAIIFGHDNLWTVR